MRNCVLALLLLCAVFVPSAVQADSNLHTVTGTMTDCGCVNYPEVNPHDPNDWVCFASIETAAPPQHFSENSKALVAVELVEQAIGHCGAIKPLLPRKVQALFWLQAAGPDYLRNIYRTGRQTYYLIDLGNP